MNLITVEEAERIILGEKRDFGTETIPFERALGRVLAEDLKADRDLPPFNRVTMDGIAFDYDAIKNNITSFKIRAIQAAGDQPVEVEGSDSCVEIMTGAALSASLDTVVRYEDVEIKDGIAHITATGIQKGQNIHLKGADKKAGEVVAAAGQLVTPAIISLAASVGKAELLVKKQPRVVIISSGDELVDVEVQPSPYQIRKSNSYTIRAVLRQHQLDADILHIPDDPAVTREKIGSSLENYDVILLSGGVSMGKFDYIPKVLQESGVKKLFHKVQQRPGKPFWFGSKAGGVLVFAFPGNPVATFMCLRRYFITWLNNNLGINPQKQYAVLGADFTFTPALKYFLQVKIRVNEKAQLVAMPVEGNGSGDFANLADTDAFLELPLERNEFYKGEVFPIFDHRFR
jgi:molybdopterin molybdotransferase